VGKLPGNIIKPRSDMFVAYPHLKITPFGKVKLPDESPEFNVAAANPFPDPPLHTVLDPTALSKKRAVTPDTSLG
jgi:hypothetical protein